MQFRKPEIDWVLYRDGKAAPTDSAAVGQLIGTLSGPGAIVAYVDDPKEQKNLIPDKPHLIVRVWVDSQGKKDDKEEKKDDKKKDDKKKDGKKKDDKAKDDKATLKLDPKKAVTELRFGASKGPNVAVERVWGDEKAVVLVDARLLSEFQKGPLAFYDKSLPPLVANQADVTKVEYRRPDGTPVEVVRKEGKEGALPTWEIVKPDGLKGRPANAEVVQGIIRALNRPRAVGIEAASPPKDAKTYALTQDKTRHVVTLWEKDAGNLYVKWPGREPVYVVPKNALTKPLEQEVRDTTIFNFRADQVTTVKVTGWGDNQPRPQTYTLEKSGDKWVVKEDKTLVVDANKVRNLLDTMEDLKAEKFTTAGKGFDFKSGALKIEVTLADKKTYDLTIGGEEGNEFYASSKQLKGENALIRKGPFEEVKKKAVALFRVEQPQEK
jgi:hypothetical protein